MTLNKWYRIEKVVFGKLVTQCICDEDGTIPLEVGGDFSGKGLFGWKITAYVGCSYIYHEYGIMIRYDENHELDYLPESREEVKWLLDICTAHPDTLEHVPYMLRWLKENTGAGDQPGPERKLRL